jgi:capsular polysaccharide biosynthesis protein
MESIYTSRRSSARTSQTIDYACSLFSGWSNYYHWILEHLPKLRAIEFYKNKTKNQPTFIIPSDPPSYIQETLELLDVKPSNRFQWDSPAIDVKTLVLPSYPEANPENLHWLRTNLRDSTQKNKLKKTPNRIYISRKKAPKRRIENEKQFLNLLSDFGFERVYAEDLSVQNQIRLFSNADELIGPHGAGLTNMVWGDEMTIFEIHNDYVRDHYYVLANNLGHKYIPIQGHSTQPSQLNSNLIVDIDQIEATLTDAINR